MINEQTDIYISKNVTVLVRLPNTKKKSYLKTVINLCPANVSHLYPWKYKKTGGFLMFSGSIEVKHWPENVLVRPMIL